MKQYNYTMRAVNVNMKIPHIMTVTLECTVHFLSEKRTRLYQNTVKGVSQLKNFLGAKNFRSAASSAGWQADEACLS